ncbi:membrane protein of unknown function (plasmid) [Azospirillum baldaniorum]|uniref:AbrB family transcriptional regulator n=1 Tax=Azospirillum baldaniorum TaxID=1064539 RepID=A0A9P1JXJ2_9PROT|nr:membrane protein of unknown function [Azospirillum baldaniorum]
MARPRPTGGRAPEQSADMMPLSNPLQWCLLVGATLLFTALFMVAGLPGATLLGPMAAAILLGVRGASIELPKRFSWLAQALTGGVVARSMDVTILHDVALHWFPMLMALSTMLAGAVLVGWLLERSGRFPGGTALWGTMPGAAPAMIAMAGDFGGDPRFVAVMQYLRVIVVVVLASLVCHFLLGSVPVPIAVPGRRSRRRSRAIGLRRLDAGAGGGRAGRRLGRDRDTASGGAAAGADPARRHAQHDRAGGAGLAVLADRRRLHDHRLDDRPALPAGTAARSGGVGAADAAVHLRSGGDVARLRLAAGHADRQGPADRLSGDQPRRVGLGDGGGVGQRRRRALHPHLADAAAVRDNPDERSACAIPAPPIERNPLPRHFPTAGARSPGRRTP